MGAGLRRLCRLWTGGAPLWISSKLSTLRITRLEGRPCVRRRAGALTARPDFSVNGLPPALPQGASAAAWPLWGSCARPGSGASRTSTVVRPPHPTMLLPRRAEGRRSMDEQQAAKAAACPTIKTEIPSARPEVPGGMVFHRGHRPRLTVLSGRPPDARRPLRQQPAVRR